MKDGFLATWRGLAISGRRVKEVLGRERGTYRVLWGVHRAIIGWALGYRSRAEEGLSVRVALLGIFSVSISLGGRVILGHLFFGFPS